MRYAVARFFSTQAMNVSDLQRNIQQLLRQGSVAEAEKLSCNACRWFSSKARDVMAQIAGCA
jgi:hypothetical protein